MLSEIYLHRHNYVRGRDFEVVEAQHLERGNSLAFAYHTLPYDWNFRSYILGKIITIEEVTLLPAVRIETGDETGIPFQDAQIIPARSVVLDCVGRPTPITSLPKNRTGECSTRDLFGHVSTLQERRHGKLNQPCINMHFPTIPYNFMKLVIESDKQYLHVVGGVHILPKYDI